ncbi:MAG: LPS-assembly protein LptD [Selenomonadaceae bacterium]|nr:LPS-assembly protein LptD [Selenomonadaceae bacterium]
MKKLFIIITTIIMSIPISGLASEYRSSSDTGVEIFDYIENRRREERANKLTDEQIKLLKDIETIKGQLPKPNSIDANKPAPAVFEGDDLTYNADTGEFVATGKVDIIQIDGRRFQSKEISGNVKEQEIRVDGRAHMLSVAPNAPRVTLDGYRTVYNYGTQTGKMGRARGKAGEYYITGKRFEFYPDHIVVFDATQTKCSAANPDYRVSAEKMEIWPEQVIKMYKVKFWIKNTVVASKAYEERDLNATQENNFPRVGYNKDHGLYVEQRFERAITDHLKSVTNAHIETKKGIRSNTEIRYDNRDTSAKFVYGFYSDSDNVWIQKEPSLILNYGRHFGSSPYSYGLGYEIGHWRGNSISSTHQKYEVGFDRDPINIHKYLLFLHTGYSITRESADNSTVKGLNYSALLFREYNERFAAFTRYSYNKNTSKNSLFDFDNDDYSRKFTTGLSYRLDDKNRIVIGADFDTDRGSLEDLDYYWFHDLHCSQIIMRYREKRDKFEARWQFTPW